jgi:hypothetical protein
MHALTKMFLLFLAAQLLIAVAGTLQSKLHSKLPVTP